MHTATAIGIGSALLGLGAACMLKGAGRGRVDARTAAYTAKALHKTMGSLSDSLRSLEKLVEKSRSTDPRKHARGEDYERAMDDVRVRARDTQSALRAGALVVDDVISWAK